MDVSCERCSLWHRKDPDLTSLLGLWLSPNASTPPILTLFGSTNLNSRSAEIDTELSFLMISPPEKQARTTAATDFGSALRDELGQEVAMIRSNAGEWKGRQRKVRWSTKFIVGLLDGML